MSRRHIVYAMTGAEGVCGGIATANKNSLRAVISVAKEHGYRLSVVSLHESASARPSYLPSEFTFYGCSGYKVKFAAKIVGLGLLRACFIFDHVTLALPVFPLVMLGWCRSVIIAHGSEADDRMKLSSRWSYLAAEMVLTNSELTLRKLRDRVPVVRARTCLLGLSPDIPLLDDAKVAISPGIELGSVDGELRRIGGQMLLLVARIDAGEMEKGHEAVVRAVSKLRDSFPELQVVFPGPGAGRDKIAQLANQLRVADKVFLPGFVTSEILVHLYRTCYSFVMPSQQEGFGLVYLEAMNYAKSCIGCRNDGAEEIILHEETGLLQRDQNDIDELVVSLTRLLENPSWNAVLGCNGRSRLLEHYSSSMHQQRFADAIKALIA
jgi:phosphatidyl-myo-inositol dimannoside synthase